MHVRSQTKRLASGDLAVRQDQIGDLEITWNPDDERFYVSNPDGKTLGTFARRDNAITFARRQTST